MKAQQCATKGKTKKEENRGNPNQTPPSEVTVFQDSVKNKNKIKSQIQSINTRCT